MAPKWRHNYAMNLEQHKNQERSRQSIRLDPNLWGAIDALRKNRPGTISRNTWITEAILEKLERDGVEAPSSMTKEVQRA